MMIRTLLGVVGWTLLSSQFLVGGDSGNPVQVGNRTSTAEPIRLPQVRMVSTQVSNQEEVDGFRSQLSELGLVISWKGKKVCEYVFRDPKIPRPYFAHLHSPDGTQVSRNHPPIKGIDPVDHEMLHPGLWLAFGDLNGTDFWRNKGRVEHVRFTKEPKLENERLVFAVEERYVDPNNSEVCRGENEYCFVSGQMISPAVEGTLILIGVTLTNDQSELSFGAQHEMGLGFRVASPRMVKGGVGTIRSNHGGVNEVGNWGRIGSWWDYSGDINGTRSGILAVASPINARPVWAHARDYGFIALNPTGPPPGIKDIPSIAFTVPKGESFKMDFGVLLHGTSQPKGMDISDSADAVTEALKLWSRK